jgi:Uma2 family endonuclease
MGGAAARLVDDDAAELGPLEEQRVFLHDQTWSDYLRLVRGRGDGSVPRITYLEGEIELMAPGFLHEDDEKKLARVIEAWADARGQYLEGFGSWTLKRKEVERGSEPDECYVVIERPRSKIHRPDLAIEVVRTSGGISKLEVYRKLGIAEVWFWSRGRLQMFALRRGKYTECARSGLLPALDPALVARAMRQPTQSAAVKLVRAAKDAARR